SGFRRWAPRSWRKGRTNPAAMTAGSAPSTAGPAGRTSRSVGDLRAGAGRRGQRIGQFDQLQQFGTVTAGIVAAGGARQSGQLGVAPAAQVPATTQHIGKSGDGGGEAQALAGLRGDRLAGDRLLVEHALAGTGRLVAQ